LIWTAIIQAYSIHGDAKEAFKLFEIMQKHVKPDAVTFVCLLNACSHAGLVECAWETLTSMKHKYGIDPDTAHQACMVDAWGRAGKLEQAENFIKQLGKQDPILWRTLLSASHNWNDVGRAQRAASQVWLLDPQNAATYVLLANTYAAVGRWKEQVEIWTKMKTNNIKKTPGATWVTVNGQTEIFYVDSSHLYPISL
jgi:pentatricopeptide repeat protein